MDALAEKEEKPLEVPQSDSTQGERPEGLKGMSFAEILTLEADGGLGPAERGWLSERRIKMMGLL